MISFPNRGLYAITQSENKQPEHLFNEVAAAIRGGAAVIQYRDKAPADALMVARELVKICHQHKIPLIINDDIGLAAESNADGVHLGREDCDISEARRRLGDAAIIGVSCYNSVERALTAQSLGTTYVAFGRFYPSASKPLAAPADIETLGKAKALIQLPIVAIGGILPENGGELLTAGADLLAVIGGVFDDDPEQSARNYQRLFVD
jgi:thiamine-phosphate pyrophosphorylase